MPTAPHLSRSQGLVEFALIMPIVLLLLAGIADIGRAVYFSIQLTNAAEQGVRVAVLPDRICNTLVGTPSTCSGSGIEGQSVCGAIDAALPGMTTGSINCSENGAVTPGPSPAGLAYVEVDQFSSFNSADPCSSLGATYSSATPRGAGNLPVRVQIDYYYRPITPVLSSLFPSGFHLHAESCGRSEY